MMSIAKLLAATTVAAVLLTGPLAFATEYFIDPAGLDSKTGTSATEAWASLTNLSKVKAGDKVNFKAGGEWQATLKGLTIDGATWQSYGTGPRPRILGAKYSADAGAAPLATVELKNKSIIDGFFVTADTNFAIYIMGDNSIIRNCEVDGTKTGVGMAVGIWGSHNLVTQNYAHDLDSNTGDTGNVNSSGGAECFVVFGGSDIEVSYNTAIKCACKNKTLGGDEGGCVEVINPQGGTTISNVRMHHNYCEGDVGLFEACTGSGTGKEDPSKNPGTIQDFTLSYNFCVDSKWLFLLQILNTHMKNVVFEHNTIMHTPKNQTAWDQGSMSHQDMLGMFFYSDSGTGSSVSSVVGPTDVIVRNNLFVEPHNTTGVWIGSGFAHNNNIFAPKTMALKDQAGGTFKLDATDILIDTVDALKLTADYRLGVGSPAIDKGATEGTMTYVDDIDLHKVPCGSGPDIGASEYCDGQASIPHPPVGGISGGVDGGSTGQGGATGSGGAKGTGGATSPTGSGGAPATGGGPGSGGKVGGGGTVGSGGGTLAGGGAGGSVIGTGGKSGSGGAVGSGGSVGNGGATGSGGAQAAGGVSTVGNGGTGNGGSIGSGGNTAGSGSSSTKTIGTSNGCSCALGGHGTPGSSLLPLGLALILPLLRRRR